MMKGGAVDLSGKNVDKSKADELLKQAYERYYTSIYRFCLSRLPNDRSSVDDCVQEAFIVLYNKYLENEKIEFVQAFLFKTANNFVLKQIRKNQKQSEQVSVEEIIHIPSQAEDIDDRLTFEEYSRQISAALNDTDAEIFRLRYVDDLDIKEIAEETGLSLKATYARMERMRNKIREILGEEFFKA